MIYDSFKNSKPLSSKTDYSSAALSDTVLYSKGVHVIKMVEEAYQSLEPIVSLMSDYLQNR